VCQTCTPSGDDLPDACDRSGPDPPGICD
jgi:hypothetical protein